MSLEDGVRSSIVENLLAQMHLNGSTLTTDAVAAMLLANGLDDDDETVADVLGEAEYELEEQYPLVY